MGVPRDRIFYPTPTRYAIARTKIYSTVYDSTRRRNEGKAAILATRVIYDRLLYWFKIRIKYEFVRQVVVSVYPGGSDLTHTFQCT